MFFPRLKVKNELDGLLEVELWGRKDPNAEWKTVWIRTLKYCETCLANPITVEPFKDGGQGEWLIIRPKDPHGSAYTLTNFTFYPALREKMTPQKTPGWDGNTVSWDYPKPGSKLYLVRGEEQDVVAMWPENCA